MDIVYFADLDEDEVELLNLNYQYSLDKLAYEDWQSRQQDADDTTNDEF